MSTKYKLLLSIILIGIIGVGCFYLGKGQREVITEEKIVYKQGETRVEYKDRIVIREKIVKPDGTIIERDRTEEKEGSKEKKKTEVSESNSSSSKPILSSYSLGVKYWFPVSLDKQSYTRDNIEITAGRRLIGEIWLDGGYRLDHSFSLGVSLKF